MLLVPIAVATLALLALIVAPGSPRDDGPEAASAGAPEEESGLLAGLIRRFTREESVSIRIDAERRMVLDRPVSDDWLVLDHRWLDSGEETSDDSMSYVGAVMSEDSHIAITPPFVVLTRGAESILLRMDAERTVSVDEPMPDWVHSDPDSGMVVARFDGFGDARIGADTVRLQRRFFDW